jgi:hypothetical protein
LKPGREDNLSVFPPEKGIFLKKEAVFRYETVSLTSKRWQRLK